jgi:hypothetical protein
MIFNLQLEYITFLGFWEVKNLGSYNLSCVYKMRDNVSISPTTVENSWTTIELGSKARLRKLLSDMKQYYLKSYREENPLQIQ